MSKPDTGYRRPRKVYELTFEDGELAGLWMRCRMVDLARFNAIADMAEVTATAGALPTKEDRERLTALCQGFGKALLDWNYEDEDGRPIPVSELADQDIDFVMALVTAWMNAATPDGEQQQRELDAAPGLPDVVDGEIDEEWLSQLPVQASQ